MTTDPTIAAGVAAWSRLRSAATFQDWIAVAKALAVGRAECMRKAGCNTPFGSRYNAATGAWLAQHGLQGVSGQERWQCFEVLENLDAIDAWRAELDDAQRRKWAHPNSILCRWRASLSARAPARHHVTGGRESGRYGKAIFLPQDMLARAAAAVVECRSNDSIVIAKAALQAAIRGADDVAELLAPQASVRGAVSREVGRETKRGGTNAVPCRLSLAPAP